ncbi:hypothetical protein HRbin06_00959 [archaeon HR06]|nr:hypothetical protein HRbin06_00959 [archaeon HR06]
MVIRIINELYKINITMKKIITDLSILTLISITLSLSFLISDPLSIPGGIQQELSDFYGLIAGGYLWKDLLSKGTLPFPVFWFHNANLGNPSTIFTGAITFSDLPYFLIFLLTEDPFLSLKIFVTLSYFLSSATMYFYSRSLSKHRVFNLAASIIYAFSSYRIYEITLGHWIIIWAAVIFPIFLLAFEKVLENPSLKVDGFLALSFALLLLSDPHHFLWALIYVTFRLIFHIKKINIHLIKHLSFSSFISFLILFPLYFPFLTLHPFTRTLEESKPYFATLESFLTRGWVSFSPTLFESFSIHLLYLGYVTLALTFLQILIMRFDARNRIKALFFFILLTFSILYALGDYSPIPIYRSLFDLLPFLKFFRVPHRIMSLIVLSLAILASLTLMHIYEVIKRRKIIAKILISILLIFILIDFNYGLTVSTVKVPKSDLHYFLSEEKEEFRILEIPSFWAITYYYSAKFKPEAYIPVSYGYYTKLPYPDIKEQQYFLAGSTFTENFEKYWEVKGRVYFDKDFKALRTSYEEAIIRQKVIKRDYEIKGDHIFQIFSYPLLSEKLHLISNFMLKNNSSISFKLNLEDNGKNYTLIYSKDIGNITIPYKFGEWIYLDRNIVKDLKDLGLKMERPIIKSLEVVTKGEVLIKRVSLEDKPELGLKYAMLGVKYILLYSDKPNTLDCFTSSCVIQGSPDDVKDVLVSLWNINESDDFEFIKSDGDKVLFKNKFFKGLAFILKEDLPIKEASFLRPDTNTIYINVQGPGTLLISERYHQGWVIQPNTLRIENKSNLMMVELPREGNYNIVLHFSPYEYYLTLLIICWSSVAVILSWKKLFHLFREKFISFKILRR